MQSRRRRASLPRVLFASPWQLLDTTSGGAIHMRMLLQELAKRGFPCEVVSGPWNSHPGPPPGDPRRRGRTILASRGRRGHWFGSGPARLGLGGDARPASAQVAECVSAQDRGFVHRIVDISLAGAQHRPDAAEEGWLRLVERRIEDFRPDLIMTWSRDHSEGAVERLASRKGIPTLLHILTLSGMPDPAVAQRLTRIVANSRFIADLVERAVQREVAVLYPPVMPSRILTTRRGARFVTVMNPSPEKGLAVLCRIIEQAQRKLPGVRFLIVEGRWSKDFIEATGINITRFPNVLFMPNQRDVRRVYARTRILLFPSLWPETFGLGAAEAHLNGIPVIAHRGGGLPEALNGAGVLLELPRLYQVDPHAYNSFDTAIQNRWRENFLRIPTARDIEPWIAQIRSWVDDPVEFRRAQQAARRAAARFLPDPICDDAAALIHGMLR